jgi:hypothetical protein
VKIRSRLAKYLSNNPTFGRVAWAWRIVVTWCVIPISESPFLVYKYPINGSSTIFVFIYIDYIWFAKLGFDLKYVFRTMIFIEILCSFTSRFFENCNDLIIQGWLSSKKKTMGHVVSLSFGPRSRIEIRVYSGTFS